MELKLNKGKKSVDKKWVRYICLKCNHAQMYDCSDPHRNTLRCAVCNSTNLMRKVSGVTDEGSQ